MENFESANYSCKESSSQLVRGVLLDDCRPEVKTDLNPPRESWQNPDGSIKWDEADKGARDFLQERADDPKRNLSGTERAIMKTVGKAILDNDVESVQNLLQSYQSNPRDLQRAMWALGQDLQAGGVSLDYSMASQPGGKEAGTLRIHMDTSNSYVEMSTNPANSTEIRGPIVSMYDQRSQKSAGLERRGDFLYGHELYSGIVDFLTERSAFALRIYDRQHPVFK